MRVHRAGHRVSADKRRSRRTHPRTIHSAWAAYARADAEAGFPSQRPTPDVKGLRGTRHNGPGVPGKCNARIAKSVELAIISERPLFRLDPLRLALRMLILTPILTAGFTPRGPGSGPHSTGVPRSPDTHEPLASSL